VALDEYVQSWQGVGFRHIPRGNAFDVLDFRFAGVGSENRWNVSGEPTLYLAGDLATAVAEFARHFQAPLPTPPGVHTAARQLYRLELTLDVLDLRLAEVLAALSLDGAPQRSLDRAVPRATARFVRTTTRAQAVFAPSMAFLDRPERWILIVFLERLPDDPRRFIHSAMPDSVFNLTAQDRSPPS
jgi:RES domain-containing protein